MTVKSCRGGRYCGLCKAKKTQCHYGATRWGTRGRSGFSHGLFPEQSGGRRAAARPRGAPRVHRTSPTRDGLTPGPASARGLRRVGPLRALPSVCLRLSLDRPSGTHISSVQSDVAARPQWRGTEHTVRARTARTAHNDTPSLAPGRAWEGRRAPRSPIRTERSSCNEPVERVAPPRADACTGLLPCPRHAKREEAHHARLAHATS